MCMVITQLASCDDAEEELQIVFNRFDKDNDGLISAADLGEMFAELGTEVDEDEVKDIIFCLDKDEDENINFQEFVQVMMYNTTDQVLDNIEQERGRKKPNNF